MEEKLKNYKEMFENLKMNSSMCIYEDEIFVKNLLEILNEPKHEWLNGRCKIFKIKKTKDNSLMDVLTNHVYGKMRIKMKVNNIRNIVSRYNAMTGENFKVYKLDDNLGLVFKELDECKVVSNAFYLETKQKMQEKLDLMKSRIVGDDFFTEKHDKFYDFINIKQEEDLI